MIQGMAWKAMAFRQFESVATAAFQPATRQVAVLNFHICYKNGVATWQIATKLRQLAVKLVQSMIEE